MDVTKNSLIFGVGPVRELVVASFPCGAGFVVLIYVILDIVKVLHACGKFINTWDALVIFSQVVEVVNVHSGGYTSDGSKRK